MYRLLLVVAAALALAIGCTPSKPAPSATTPPAQQQPETATPPKPAPTPPATKSAPRSAMPPMVREKYRMVHGEDEIVSVLENDCVVITKRVVGSPVLSVRGYVRTGGVFEGKWEGAGLSHLLEHLVAGGSNTRRSEAESRELLQQLGNNSNAYTTDDHTAYFVNTTPQNLDKAADLVTGWMLHALITPEEFKREHQVVRRELEMGRGEPGRQFHYMAAANRYRVSPAGVPVIGYWEVIEKLSRDDVYSYYQMAYQPNNMVFSVAGDLPPETMLATMQRYIDLPVGRVFDRAIPAEPEVMTPRTMVATMPKIGEAHVMISYPTVSLDHPDLYALDLLAAAIGQSEGSVLVREVRERKLASSISAFSSTPDYVSGSFGIAMRTAPDKVDAALEAVQIVLDHVKREPIDAETIDRARTQMRVAQMRELEQTEHVASDLATNYLSTGDIHFTTKYIERLAKVTPADLQAVARKYFDNQRLIKTVMLPTEATQGKGLPSAEALLRQAGAQASTATAAPAAGLSVQKSELDNGTVLLVRRVPTSPLIAVRMYALGGLTAETSANNGVGNLTMKMLERGTTFRSANQLADELDAIGADVETACGNNTWYWTSSMPKEDFEKGMELFADVVNNPSFDAKELDSMRSRVLAGIAAQDADWTGQAMRFFKKQFFPKDSPYRFQPIGQAEAVTKLQGDDLKAWYQQQILPARRVLAIYGDLDPQIARRVAAKFLGGGPKITASVPHLQQFDVHAPSVSTQPSANVQRVEVQQTQQALAGIVVGYESRSVIGDPSAYPRDVADTMVSGWGYPTGYLHETLRGQGLVYMVHAQDMPGRSAKLPGTFFVISGCQPDKVNTVVDQILLNIARLQGTPQDVQPQWFARSMDLLITDDAMSNETVTEQATTAALDELWGLGYDYHAKFSQYVKAVTLDDVRHLATEELRNCVVTISTPSPELVDIKPGLRTYSSFPEVELTPKGVQHDMPAGK